MRTLIFTLFMLTSIQLSQAGSSDVVWFSYVGTNQYAFTARQVEIAKTPIWQKRDDQPPLPAGKALRLARACLAKLLDDSKNWELYSLDLQPLGRDGHWVYLVYFQPTPPTKGQSGGAPVMIAIPVLMSGVAVDPVISPWKGYTL